MQVFDAGAKTARGLAATLILGPAAIMWKASASLFAALTLATLAGQARAEAPEPIPTAQICDRTPGAWDDTAEANAISLYALEWTPFGPSELGWEAYVPLMQQEVGSPCDPTSAGFAEALATFQARYGLAATGRIDRAGLDAALAEQRTAKTVVSHTLAVNALPEAQVKQAAWDAVISGVLSLIHI